MSRANPQADDFVARMPAYVRRVESFMDCALPGADRTPVRLHEAMRYAALSGGKRIRPLLVYAAGECLGVAPDALDVPAAAIEFIHSFSLVHDDLPAMDNDDLRRGQPTVHRKFDEATAILAADALQPLAFEIIATAPGLSPSHVAGLVALISGACGSLGMTGGQAIDLASEGRQLSVDALAELHGLKTGALIGASVMASYILADDLDDTRFAALKRFSEEIGLAFQIRDDLLDVEGETDVIGKPVGSDEALKKATWPALFGVEESRQRCAALLTSAISALDMFGASADSLRFLAHYIVERKR